MTLEVKDLGLKPYKEVWALQKEYLQHRAQGLIPNQLLLVEHPPVFTTGRKFKPEHLKQQSQIPVFPIERGGDITFHEPGQLIGYPIIYFPPEQRDIKQYLNRLETLLIKTLAEFNIQAESTQHTGVWVGHQKIASIGISIKRWTSYHGFALNVNNPLEHVKMIQPCGFDPEIMTTMENTSQTNIELLEVKSVLKKHAQDILVYAPH